MAPRMCAEERVLSVCGEMAHRKRTGKLDKVDNDNSLHGVV